MRKWIGEFFVCVLLCAERCSSKVHTLIHTHEMRNEHRPRGQEFPFAFFSVRLMQCQTNFTPVATKFA